MTDQQFGVVTMAVEPDAVVRACGLAASLRHHHPDWPVCLLTTSGSSVPPGFFDSVVTLPDPEPFSGPLRYLNKLIHPFTLSPFDRTLFLDDDMLVIRPLDRVLRDHFVGRALAINTIVCTRSEPRPGTNHLDPATVCDELGVDRCRNTYGGGHMYFEHTAGTVPMLAQAALAVVADERALYERWAQQPIVSDEVALLIAVNRFDVAMPNVPDFVDALSLYRADRARFSVAGASYSLPDRSWGDDTDQVAILHFCSSAKRAASYSREVHRLTGLRQSFDRGQGGIRRRLGHDALRLAHRS